VNAPAPTLVEDQETLLRSVPASGEYYSHDPSGNLQLSSTAFNDRNRQPSMDRQVLLQSVDAAKKSATDGLIKLEANEIRAIQLHQVDNRGKPKAELHAIDVIYSPVLPGNAQGLAPNPAHSHLETNPPISASRFNRLKELLARAAQKYGWIIKPT
jgi:hypothetical protein